MSYTHICIETGTVVEGTNAVPPFIKKGEYVTCRDIFPDKNVISGIGMKFKEDKNNIYSSHLFLPLPPQKEKIVYVAVTEEIKKEVEEPALN